MLHPDKSFITALPYAPLVVFLAGLLAYASKPLLLRSWVWQQVLPFTGYDECRACDGAEMSIIPASNVSLNLSPNPHTSLIE